MNQTFRRPSHPSVGKGPDEPGGAGETADLPMQRRTFIATTASTATALALAGCVGEEEDNSDNATGNGGGNNSSGNGNDNGSDGSGVDLLEHEMSYDSTLGPTVTGRVVNNTGEEQSYIEVQARFFDSEDTRIGEGLWNATDVPDGQELQFECTAMTDQEPASYEVETGTGGL